jgi:hypothetical protein
MLHSSTDLALQRREAGVQAPVHRPAEQDTAQVETCSQAVPVTLQISTELAMPQREAPGEQLPPPLMSGIVIVMSGIVIAISGPGGIVISTTIPVISAGGGIEKSCFTPVMSSPVRSGGGPVMSGGAVMVRSTPSRSTPAKSTATFGLGGVPPWLTQAAPKSVHSKRNF